MENTFFEIYLSLMAERYGAIKIVNESHHDAVITWFSRMKMSTLCALIRIDIMSLIIQIDRVNVNHIFQNEYLR